MSPVQLFTQHTDSSRFLGDTNDAGRVPDPHKSRIWTPSEIQVTVMSRLEPDGLSISDPASGAGRHMR